MNTRFIPKATEHTAPDELGESLQGAPRPVEVQAAQAESLEMLTSGEGAVIHSKKNAADAAKAARKKYQKDKQQHRLKGAKRPHVKAHMAPRKKMGRPLFIGICVGVAAVVVLLVVLFTVALNAPSTSLERSNTPSVENTQADAETGISYEGYTYKTLQNDDGSWVFVRTAKDGSSPLTLFNLEGTPVELILYNGAFVIPQNLDNAWNVMAWVSADGSVPDLLTRSDGSTVEGSGQIASAQLVGQNLQLNFDNDVTDTILLQ